MIDTDLRALLVSDSGVAAIVGDGASPETFRIYPDELLQKQTLDSLVYRLIHGSRDYAHDGPSGFNTSRFQIDCWSKTRKGSITLANAVEKLLSGYTGNVGLTSFQHVTLDHEYNADDRDEPRDAATTVVLRRRVLEFEVKWNDLTP